MHLCTLLSRASPKLAYPECLAPQVTTHSAVKWLVTDTESVLAWYRNWNNIFDCVVCVLYAVLKILFLRCSEAAEREAAAPLLKTHPSLPLTSSSWELHHEEALLLSRPGCGSVQHVTAVSTTGTRHSVCAHEHVRTGKVRENLL